MSQPPDISQSEWQIMKVVWDRQPVVASEIIKTLSETHDWTAATIRTFLHRLVKKGALAYEQTGNRYLYRAAVPRGKIVKQASSSFLKSVFAGESGPLIAHFVKSSRLTPEEIQSLRKLLDEKESQ